jgi:hypothetical protein
LYKRFERAADLPEEWDELCKDNVYLSRDFLTFMDRANPCHQSYHAFYENDKIYSGFMMFEQKFNLFIFTPLKIKCKMKFVYLPLSASEPSIVFGQDTTEIEQILHSMKGIKIVINVDKQDTLKGFAQGHYLPVCIIDLKWDTFEEYMDSLRSGYRYRYKKALKKGAKIEYEILADNNNFTQEMYTLYEQVFNHAEYSLEKLSLEFFKNDISKIICMKIDGKSEAMIQIIENKDTLIFEFGGFNYKMATQYDLYHNMLLYMMKYAIDNGFKRVHYGQTAYDAKMKLGCNLYEKFFLLSHNNKFINYLIHKFTGFLEYKADDWSFSVFKEDTP